MRHDSCCAASASLTRSILPLALATSASAPADEYFCIVAQLSQNLSTYAHLSAESAPPHALAPATPLKGASLVASCVLITAAALHSLQSMLFATLLACACWLAFLLFVEVEQWECD